MSSDCSAAAKVGACYRARARLLESLLDDLYDLASARDRRAVPAALLALDTREPDVQRAALRVLGQFPNEPDVAARALALLLEGGDYDVEGLAANVLRGSRDAGHRRIAAQYLRGHVKAGAHDWDEDRGAAELGVEPFPGAQPYPPGESTHSLGFMTSTPLADVVAFHTKNPDAAVLARTAYASEWWTRQRKRSADDPRAHEEAALRKEHARTHDAALLQRANELRAALAKERDARIPPLTRGDTPMPGFGRDVILADARWVVLDAKPPYLDRAALLYTEPALGKTIVIVGWSPAPRKTP